MAWKKGQSGNPNGRPKKNKALTEILRKAGSKSMEWEGKRISGRQWMARKLWEIIRMGRATFPGESEDEPKVMIVSPKDWIGVAQWIYNRVDGPPRAELDVTSLGEQVGSGVNIDLSKLSIAQLKTLDSIAESIFADGSQSGDSET